MAFNWQTEGMTAKFLTVYRNYEVLWNPSIPGHRDTVLREQVLTAMVEELGLPNLTVPDVVEKINSVRSRYAVELAKVLKSEKSGAGADDVYKPKLDWFPLAHTFLRKWVQPKPSSSNLKVSDAGCMGKTNFIVACARLSS